jgi:uncharacterized protein YndB with AHSA1/START domain
MDTGALQITTPSRREIVMTRVFDAPRRLVFDAWTRPELLRRWFGPRGHRLVVCEVDLRVGGSWQFVVRAPDGSEMALRGTYLEVVVPERVVSVEASECDAQGDAESRGTIVLVEDDGRTTLTHTVLYPSQDVRDAVLASGMEHGVAEGYDKLAETLAAHDVTVTP